MRFFHCNHCVRNVYIKSVIIAATQLPLNRLRHKSKQEAKQVETRQKIILGAEVAKAINSKEYHKAIVPQITGRAWISGQTTLMLDPDDPYPDGYKVSDTWPNP